MPAVSSSTRSWLLALLAVCALASTLDAWRGSASPDSRLEQTRDLLQGTWLREYTAPGVSVRRVLTLAPGGAFSERGRVVDADGHVMRYVHEGTWLYDGTNLKRKYTMVNGKPPSRLQAPFATVEIWFETRNDFVGVDHIHRNRMHYRRVAPGSEREEDGPAGANAPQG